MSRELKFRAWDKDLEEMFDVDIINFVTRTVEGISQYKNITQLPFDGVILRRPTGLKDKNGVEIYEGDIVRDSRIEESEAVIEYCQPIAAFVARPIIKAPYDVYQLNEGNTMGSLKLSYTEVIGNIYENPDLLKGEPNE